MRGSSDADDPIRTYIFFGLLPKRAAAANDMIRVAGEFGFSPAARASIVAGSRCPFYACLQSFFDEIVQMDVAE